MISARMATTTGETDPDYIMIFPRDLIGKQGDLEREFAVERCGGEFAFAAAHSK
jgi:hypothetical protein